MIIAAKATVASAAPPGLAAYLVDGNGYVWSLDSTQTLTQLTDATANTGQAVFFDDDVILVGSNADIVRSLDNTATWTQEATNLNVLGFATNGTGTYVSVGSSGGTPTPDSRYSTNTGDSWTQKKTGLPTTNFMSAQNVYWNGTKFLATVIAGTGLYDNADPAANNWTSITTGMSGAYDLCYSGSLYVLVGGSGTLRTSPDLTTWTARTSQFSTSNIFSVATNGSTYVAVGADGKISESTDGTTWNSRTSGVTSSLFRVQWSSVLNKFIVVGDTYNSKGVVLVSSDGITWTDISPTYNVPFNDCYTGQ